MKALAIQGLAALEDEPRRKVLVELIARWYPYPLGRRRLGEKEQIEALDHDAVVTDFQRRYQPGGTILAMDLSHGGHLTHGAPVSHMGKIFNFVRYKTYPDEQGRIDFDEVRRMAAAVAQVLAGEGG